MLLAHNIVSRQIKLLYLHTFFQLHYERTEARRKLLKEQGRPESDGPKLSDRWKRVLGSALSSIPRDDGKSCPNPLLGKIVALGRRFSIFFRVLIQKNV